MGVVFHIESRLRCEVIGFIIFSAYETRQLELAIYSISVSRMCRLA